MKYLALAALLAVMQAAPPVPRKAANNPGPSSQHIKKHSDTNKAPTAQPQPCGQIVEPHPDQPGSQGVTKNNAPQDVRVTYLPIVSVEPDWGTWIFSGLLVVVGGLQVWLLRGALKAAQDNAKAAALNAQAVINAERAWILVNPKPKEGAPGKFIVGGFNAGRTPAIIIDGHCSCKLHPADYVPPEDLNDPMDQPKRNLIVSKDSFVVKVIDPESRINQADRDRVGTIPQIVFVYGKLRYWDAFTDGKAPEAKPCGTWWCFRYDPTTKSFDTCDNGYARHE